MNILEFLFGFPVDAHSVEKDKCYILVFCGCRWEFVPYSDVVGGGVDIMDEGTLVAPAATCMNFVGSNVSASLGEGCVNINITGGQYLIPSNEIVINVNEPEIVGKQYQSFANAFAYLSAPTEVGDLAPAMYNRWTIRFSGPHTEDIDVPPFVNIYGDGMLTAMLLGEVKMTFVIEPFSNTFQNCYINNLFTFFSTGGATQQPVYTGVGHGVDYSPDICIFVILSKDGGPLSGTYRLSVNGTRTENIPYNAGPAAILAAIYSADPTLNGMLSLTDYSLSSSEIYATINYIGLPSNDPTNTLDLDTSLMAAGASGIVEGYTKCGLGSVEQQLISFSHLPTQGIFHLSLVGPLGSTISSPQVVWVPGASYDDMIPYVQAAMDSIISGLQAADPSGIYGVPVVTSYINGFIVTFNGWGGNTNMMTIHESDKKNPLEYEVRKHEPINATLDHVCVANCTSGDNEGSSKITMVNDCKVFGGDFVGCQITGTGTFLQGYINPIHIYESTFSQVDIGQDVYLNSCILTNCSIRELLLESGKTQLYNSHIFSDVLVDEKIQLIANQCSFPKVVKINTGGEFTNESNTIIGGVFNSGGIHNNVGEYYDNSVSGLASKDWKGAIDELAASIYGMGVLTGSGSPVGVVTPTFIGQEYLDTTGPTFYKAYGLTNADWIS